ncbi:MAG: MnmC family methyltransferase, partial [Cyanobacteria bacterium P01_H01_bin.105]
TDYRYQSSTLDIQLIIGDARQTLQPLIAEGWQADAILFDPFSPKRCPQLWTVEFLALTTRCLATGGTLVTYSCAAAVRAAMKLAGLNIGSFPGAGRHWPCTIAAHQRPLPPLSLQEQEHLRTRAAIPYRDPTLRATAEAIMAQRQQEQQLCNLESTGAWRRRWPRGREA